MHGPAGKPEALRKGEIEMQRIDVAGRLGIGGEIGRVKRADGHGRQFFAKARRGGGRS